MNQPERIVIGRVLAVEAARRSLRIQLKHKYLQSLDDCDRIWLTTVDGVPLRAKIETCERNGTSARVALTAGICRDEMQALHRAEVAVDSRDCKKVSADMPDLEELEGFKVIAPGGRLLGVVFETIDTPAGGVIRLLTGEGRTAALPVIAEVIASVDINKKRIAVVDPEPFLVMDDALGNE